MATNLKPRSEPVTYPSSNMLREPEKNSWHMRLGLSQLVVLWSVLAGTMVMVFLFGIFAGREQGLKTALDEQKSPSVRVPIARVSAPGNIGVDSSVTNLAGGVVGEGAAKTGESGKGAAAANQDLAFDFSQSAPTVTGNNVGTDLAAADGSRDSQAKTAKGNAPAIGFAGKPVMDSLELETERVGDKLGSVEKDNDKALQPAAAQTVAKVDSDAARLSDAAKLIETAKLSEPVAPVSDKALKSETAAAKGAVVETKVVEKKKKEERSAEPSEKTQSVTQPVRGKWYVQVAATETKGEAQNLVSKLRAAGHKVAQQEARVNGKTFTRVMVGPFSERNVAEASRKKVKALGGLASDPIVKKVG